MCIYIYIYIHIYIYIYIYTMICIIGRISHAQGAHACVRLDRSTHGHSWCSGVVPCSIPCFGSRCSPRAGRRQQTRRSMLRWFWALAAADWRAWTSSLIKAASLRTGASREKAPLHHAVRPIVIRSVFKISCLFLRYRLWQFEI